MSEGFGGMSGIVSDRVIDVRMAVRTVIKFFDRPDEAIVKSMGVYIGLDDQEMHDLLSERINGKGDGQLKVLSSAEKKDIIGLYYRLGEPPTVAHIEFISKQLEIKRKSVLHFLVHELWNGSVGIAMCECGRKFPSISEEDKLCVACELQGFGG